MISVLLAMPVLVISVAMTANQKNLNIFSGWQYEFAPGPSTVKLLIRATTGGVVMALYSGSETIQESSPVQGGGTAGVTPSELNTAPQIWVAAGGDRLKTKCDEVLAGTPTVDAIIQLESL
jgi:hypothetical protein